MHKVALIVGSLRQESINLRLSRALERLSEGRLQMDRIDLNLPVYNEDLWADPPASVTALKDKVRAADAVLFVTPEYNRSVPGVLKNALDWGSRPFGESCWGGKRAGIAGASPGAIGTAVSQSHLRSILPILDVRAMGQPELYLTFKPGMIEADGTVPEDRTRQFLQGWIDRFTAFLD